MNAKRIQKRVAAMADIHIKMNDRGKMKAIFEQVSHEADVLVICGDLTDTGDEDEAAILAEDLRALQIPVVGVLGNHDYEKGRQKIIKQILTEHKMTILDGESTVLSDIGFAGVKGFGGGFDQYMLSIFGEDMMKSFVHEVVNESLQLERALTRLDQEHPDIPKIALLHYAPIQETVIGEPEVLFPFLGSSRLAEPINRGNVRAAFHGHAHAGTLSGATKEGIPVFNVALPVLRKAKLDTSYYILKV
ncbi:metallophosphoesterase [Sphingobacterium sp. lm-10]|uniref:metallophosphoesterase family protein n=1 Tax=Sphingobacterium sp. lm-10 TaxID=2944904 RepID=UPI0020225B69|nr:metallophosphoesterase [Sphingobacterium sp. lm-10]MCL7987017.1 metallophosphoesterase [Sphingobacterium sp. lm-10]